MKTPSVKKPPRPVRTVSSPRRPGRTKPVAFRLEPEHLDRLDQAAQVFHRSRSQLIELAVLRCLQDGVWESQVHAWGIFPPDPSPPDDVVQISVTLQGMAMAEDLFADPKEHPKAGQILLDARQRLDRIQPSATTRKLARVLTRLSDALSLYVNSGTQSHQRRASKLLAEARAGLDQVVLALR
jgi:hypothetical protein